ncbi:MAG TPA: type VI secretion system contractile sheath large subunit [Deltaproteobacteria bacterium]|nr:type VI secretion system contractile sheath large subunit [Deltaproteobacteria bacterium]
MTKPISFGELDFRTVSSLEDSHARPGQEKPFRILIMGDFSGRSSADLSSPDIALRKAAEVDRDNIDEVMERFKVTARLRFDSNEESELVVGFNEMDDFLPDSLFERLEIFQRLRQTKASLEDPRTFEKAAGQIRSLLSPDTQAEEPMLQEEKTGRGKPAPEESADLLEKILDEASPETAQGISGRDPWSAFLHRIVSPHIVKQDDIRKQELTSVVDDAVSSLMRMILHHREFQAIEAVWRSVHFLVSRLETDSHLKVYLLDIAKQELSADVMKSEDLLSSTLYRILAEQGAGTAGADPWSVIAGVYTFENTRYDAGALGRIAKIARLAGAPFISGAHPTIIGCRSLAETPDSDEWTGTLNEEDRSAWEALRCIPEASYLGLAMPGFLLRLPYGRETEPCERFEFEEMNTQNEDYLWGNPCLACALLLGQAFSRDGWDMRPGTFLDIDNLPLHVYLSDGETEVKPCTGVLLTEKAAEVILDNGIMPLVSLKDTDTVRLVRFQSLCDPPSRLAGRWEQS